MSSSSKTEAPKPDTEPKPEAQLAPAPVWKRLTRSGWFRSVVVLAALALVLVAPFQLQPEESSLFSEASRSIVIISPHNDSIRTEFARAFAEHMKEETGEPVRIEWRDVGGTSEISRYINSSFQSTFDLYWRRVLKKRWRHPAATPGEAAVSSSEPDDTPADDTPPEAARRAFLRSNASIGVDLFFGGGTYYFQRHDRLGHFIPLRIFEEHPEWFTPEVIPAEASGEILYDPDRRWLGNCLSSFGICYNVDWIDRLGVDPPTQWTDLGQPEYAGTLALADPGKSGSAAKAFEMLIQQQLAEAVAAIDPVTVADMDLARRDALNRGWTNGLNLIQRISANARYFTDNATKIPLDVAQGNASAGMSIDFYGRTLNESLRRQDGSSRIQFVIPEGGTSVGADPIAMFRGAPNPGLAHDFVEFLMSLEGQRLWHYRPGTPGGPSYHALRRMPIRKDAFTPGQRVHSSDPDVNPYERAKDFVYHPDWTGKHLGVIRFIIQVMCLEPHAELQEAWNALIEADFPDRATNIFFDVQFVGYTNVTGDLSQKLRDSDPLIIQKRRKDLRESFRKNYLQAAALARASR